MADEKCPICGETKEDDAGAKESCELCSMGIDEPASAPVHFSDDGGTLYFCCDRCVSIYEREIVQNRETIETLKEQMDASLLDEYDESIKGMIIDYINRKYPKE